MVGTPKEIAAFASVRVFNIEEIFLCIVDDADIVISTKLIQNQIMNRLNRCRKILLSATCLTSVKDPAVDYKSINIKMPLNAAQYFLKINNVAEKFETIVMVYNLLKKFRGRCIVFCNVSIF